MIGVELYGLKLGLTKKDYRFNNYIYSCLLKVSHFFILRFAFKSGYCSYFFAPLL